MIKYLKAMTLLFVSTSAIADVTYDSGHGEKLYWIESSVLNIADCLDNRLPTRENCQLNKKSTSPEEITEKIFADLNKKISTNETAIENEDARLRNSHPTIVFLDKKIAEKNKESSKVKSEKSKLNSSINSMTKKIKSIEFSMQDYESQIEILKKKIRKNPSNDRYKKLLAKIKSEYDELSNKKDTLQKNATEANEKKEQLDSQIERLKSEVVSLKDERKNEHASIEVNSKKLEQYDREILRLEAEKGSLEDAFEIIGESGVVYRSENLTPNELKILNYIYLDQFTEHLYFSISSRNCYTDHRERNHCPTTSGSEYVNTNRRMKDIDVLYGRSGGKFSVKTPAGGLFFIGSNNNVNYDHIEGSAAGSWRLYISHYDYQYTSGSLSILVHYE